MSHHARHAHTEQPEHHISEEAHSETVIDKAVEEGRVVTLNDGTPMPLVTPHPYKTMHENIE